MSMNNVFVYCEVQEEQVVPISFELLTEGRRLANELGVQLEAIVLGKHVTEQLQRRIASYGVDILHVAEHECLHAYHTLVYTKIVSLVLTTTLPQIVLFPCTFEGCDLAPRLAARLRTGLTAHCTRLKLHDYVDPVSGERQTQCLHQIRPALGGNVEATIVTPRTRPQMVTVIPGSFVARIQHMDYPCEIQTVHVGKTLDLYPLSSIEKETEACEQSPAESQHLTTADIVVCGGYGVGSEKNFQLLKTLATIMKGEVAATRAAVDAGWASRNVQIGQTGLTVRPRLFIACGCSGALQFTSGMKDSTTIVSINSDPNAPMNALADYVVVGRVEDVLPKMIKYYTEKR